MELRSRQVEIFKGSRAVRGRRVCFGFDDGALGAEAAKYSVSGRLDVLLAGLLSRGFVCGAGRSLPSGGQASFDLTPPLMSRTKLKVAAFA